MKNHDARANDPRVDRAQRYIRQLAPHIADREAAQIIRDLLAIVQTPPPQAPDALVERLDGLYAKATKGPWHLESFEDQGVIVIRDANDDLVCEIFECPCPEDQAENEANAALIVEQRNAYPTIRERLLSGKAEEG